MNLKLCSDSIFSHIRYIDLQKPSDPDFSPEGQRNFTLTINSKVINAVEKVETIKTYGNLAFVKYTISVSGDDFTDVKRSDVVQAIAHCNNPPLPQS